MLMAAPYRVFGENHDTAMNIDINGSVVDIIKFAFFIKNCL
jgi:hypothetical protein